MLETPSPLVLEVPTSRELSLGATVATSDEAPPTDGRLAGLHPVFKLVLVLCVALMGITLDQLPSLGLLSLFCLSFMLGSGLRSAQLRPILILALAAMWGTMLSQGLFYDRQPRTLLVTLLPAWSWGELLPPFPGLFVYREGVLHGLLQSLRFVSLLLMGSTVSLTTSPERLLVGLQALKVPYGLSFMAVTALRSFPLALQEIQTVRAVWALRAPLHRRRGLLRRLKSDLAMLRPVLVKTLRRATDLATALTLRAFDPSGERNRDAHTPLTPRERAGLTMLLAGTGMIVGVKVLYLLYLHEVVYVGLLRPLYGWVRTYL